MNLIHNTPVEEHTIWGLPVYVKREDLAAPFPGPPFSKVRGLMPVLERLKAEGVTTVGYVETSVSMAGWGVAWGCSLLGMRAVIYDPIYKKTPPLLAYHREKWATFNATIRRPIKAGMARVNWNICRKLMAEEFGEKAVLLPLGLQFEETVAATAEEARLTIDSSPVKFATVVVNVGSGTIAAGVVKAFENSVIFGIMGRTGNIPKKSRSIAKKAGVIVGGLTGRTFVLVDPEWEYSQRSDAPCPFPCHPWYDLKAWEWVCEEISLLKAPILFWNIGSLPEDYKEDDA